MAQVSAVGVFFAVFWAEVLRFLKRPVASEYEVLETFENEHQALVVQSRLQGVRIASDLFCQNYGMKNSVVFLLKVVPKNAAVARALLPDMPSTAAEESPVEESEGAV